jgi:hypothetical protein
LTKYWIEPYRLHSIRASLDAKLRNVKHIIRLLTIEPVKGIAAEFVDNYQKQSQNNAVIPS